MEKLPPKSQKVNTFHIRDRKVLKKNLALYIDRTWSPQKEFPEKSNYRGLSKGPFKNLYRFFIVHSKKMIKLKMSPLTVTLDTILSSSFSGTSSSPQSCCEGTKGARISYKSIWIRIFSAGPFITSYDFAQVSSLFWASRFLWYKVGPPTYFKGLS